MFRVAKPSSPARGEVAGGSSPMGLSSFAVRNGPSPHSQGWVRGVCEDRG